MQSRFSRAVDGLPRYVGMTRHGTDEHHTSPAGPRDFWTSQLQGQEYVAECQVELSIKVIVREVGQSFDEGHSDDIDETTHRPYLPGHSDSPGELATIGHIGSDVQATDLGGDLLGQGGFPVHTHHRGTYLSQGMCYLAPHPGTSPKNDDDAAVKAEKIGKVWYSVRIHRTAVRSGLGTPASRCMHT
jgi:hypothetical protein